MLVLSRKAKQQIQIGENVVVTIVQVKGQTVRIGIEAPHEVRVVRGEIADLPAKAADEVPAGKSSMSRPERLQAGRHDIDPGFSSPLVGCTSLVGESSGLYPFVRRRAALQTATISTLAATRG
jgi:carbon storage regulator CsrA